MKLKAKISWGLGFLFLIIFSIAIFCMYYIGNLADDSNAILKDNYHSLEYAKGMAYSLNDMQTAVTYIVFDKKETAANREHYFRLYEAGKADFDKNFVAEKNNVTETNEKEYVESLIKYYDLLLKICDRAHSGEIDEYMFFTVVLPSFSKVWNSVNSIYNVNKYAIERKNQVARKDAAKIITYMSAICAFCVILAFFYFWYFPFFVSNSISYLSDKMKGLLKKAGFELETKTKDESFILLSSIELLEAKLCPGEKGKEEENQ